MKTKYYKIRYLDSEGGEGCSYAEGKTVKDAIEELTYNKNVAKVLEVIEVAE